MTPTDETLQRPVCWIKEALQKKPIATLHWCDTQDTRADEYTKGSESHDGSTKAMNGWQQFQYYENLKTYGTHREITSTACTETPSARTEIQSSVQIA